MKPLTNEEIKTELQSLDNWTFKNDKISRDFKFDDFKTALTFIVRIGFEAEKLVHHPEIFNVYNSVSVQLSTHDAGDKVTSKDIDLAKEIDKISKTF